MRLYYFYSAVLVNSKLNDFAFALTGGIEMKQSIQLNTL